MYWDFGDQCGVFFVGDLVYGVEVVVGYVLENWYCGFWLDDQVDVLLWQVQVVVEVELCVDLIWVLFQFLGDVVLDCYYFQWFVG